MIGYSYWHRWLLAVSILVTLFGFFMALTSNRPLFDLFNDRINPAFWGQAGPGPAAEAFQQWVYGVWGATVAGWGILMIFVVYHSLRQQQRWAWRALVVALLAWYLLDTVISLYHGVLFNAAFNSLLLILFLPPLLFIRKAQS